jgi:hypothetical protein
MKLIPYLSDTAVVGTLDKIKAHRRSYFKGQAHCSGYEMAQGRDLKDL